MSRKITSSILVLVFVISMSGCATIAHPKTSEVSINSNPEGASVFFDGNRVGKTPLTITASNKQPLTVSLKKEGYEEISKRVEVKTSTGCFVADCFLPPVYGCAWIILDACSGNANTLTETKLNFTLEPITTPTNK